MKNQFFTGAAASLLGVVVVLILSAGCKRKPECTDARIISHVVNPEWSVSANIYEVNTRQFTREGTFRAFMEHLPRLRNMGVDILWFMPIQPIGEVNRKGTLGSYYSVKDYRAVNTEFGTLDDFRELVAKAHELGMYVILDWVANHTAWDNYLVSEKPEWYTRDSLGNMISPYDWTDVVELNYDEPELWDYMIDAMKFWVREANIDGFRCDVAFMVPTEFWNRARRELETIKPVFMLAESEEPILHEYAFDMSYAWGMHHIMNKIAAGTKNANHIDSMMQVTMKRFPPEAYMMQFTSNHDENSWAGTEFTRLGDGVLTFAVLTATLPGMPLVYNGQEAAMDKMLEFFEKDEIDWTELPFENFYRELFTLKDQVPALWNGIHGGSYERVNSDHNEQVFAFLRKKDDSKVFVILNLSGDVVETTLHGDRYSGEFKETFIDETLSFEPNSKVVLAPWEYRVYFR